MSFHTVDKLKVFRFAGSNKQRPIFTDDQAFQLLDRNDSFLSPTFCTKSTLAVISPKAESVANFGIISSTRSLRKPAAINKTLIQGDERAHTKHTVIPFYCRHAEVRDGLRHTFYQLIEPIVADMGGKRTFCKSFDSSLAR